MIYQISSGQGPAECELGVARLLAYLQNNYDISVLETSPGYYGDTFRSARFFTEDDLSRFVGSVKWICRSPTYQWHKGLYPSGYAAGSADLPVPPAPQTGVGPFG
jgi:peptide chain release factor